MEIKLAKDKNQWDNWLEENTEFNQFTQSWQWGEILISEGKEIERLTISEDGQVVSQAQVVYSNLPFGWKYAYCPRGPVNKVSNEQIYKIFTDYLRNKKCIFSRVEPDKKFVDTNFFYQKSIDINPSTTSILSLDKTKEELLANTKKTARYNIRFSERRGVTIKKEKDFASFFELLKKTGKRDKFNLHTKKHYQKILNSIDCYQLSAIYDNKVIASNIYFGFGNTFTYLYSSSDHNYRKLMAPYLLQWQGIELAKELGYKYYDFFGVSPANKNSKITDAKKYDYDKNHEYAGITMFKVRFGGQVYNYPGTFDLIVSNGKYFIYKILRKIRRIF
jgi:peptidoglycan pentaglycine glycine transferase (the first glycine)